MTIYDARSWLLMMVVLMMIVKETEYETALNVLMIL